MKKLFLLAALIAVAPVAFADPDLGAPETGPISNPPSHGGDRGGDNGDSGDVSEDYGTPDAFACRIVNDHFDAQCVNNQTGHVLKFDHARVVNSNPACRKIRSAVYSCSSNFMSFTDAVEPDDIL